MDCDINEYLDGTKEGNCVVTLVHFYCGLRLGKPKERDEKLSIVVTLVHFYCGLRPLVLFMILIASYTSSNPCPFLLWIATVLGLCTHTQLIVVVTLVHFYCGLRQYPV